MTNHMTIEQAVAFLGESGEDESIGDVQGPGFHALFVSHTNPAEFPCAGYIYHEDNQGFKTLDSYDDPRELHKEWDNIVEMCSTFYDDEEDDEPEEEFVSCAIHDGAPHETASLACELRQAENWAQ